MQWWKKLLIALGILLVLGLGLLGYGAMKMSDVYTETIKPDMEAYVQMTEEEQDKYVLNHMEKLMQAVKAEDKEVQIEVEAMQNDPATREAGIALGRSMCALLLSASDDITSSLSAADKAKYEEEGKAIDARGKQFEKLVEEYKAGLR